MIDEHRILKGEPRPAPRRLPEPLDLPHAIEAASLDEIVLHYGPAGPQRLPAGTRFELTEYHAAGLVRVRALDRALEVAGALVDERHFDLGGLDLRPIVRPDRRRHSSTCDASPTPSSNASTAATPPPCGSSEPPASTLPTSCSASSSDRPSSTRPPTPPRSPIDEEADRLIAGEPIEIRFLPDVRARLEQRHVHAGPLELDLDFAAGTARLVRAAP